MCGCVLRGGEGVHAQGEVLNSYLCGFGNAFAEYFDFDVTEVCM